MASSSDGTKLVAVGNSIPSGDYSETVADRCLIKTSTNSGATWITALAAPRKEWLWVVSSANGIKLFAKSVEPMIYTSIDSGSTWTLLQCVSSKGVVIAMNSANMAVSSDGTKLFASGDNKSVTNGYANWFESELYTYSSAWNDLQKRISVTAVASSSDGTKLVVVGRGLEGLIITSADSGRTWTNRTSSTKTTSWNAVASSADGNRLAAIKTGADIDSVGSDIYVSVDSGVTWQPYGTKGYWGPVAISADGSTIIMSNTSCVLRCVPPLSITTGCKGCAQP